MEEDKRLLERIHDGADEPRDLPFALLKEITDDFSEEKKIGQGGFGVVYKGVLGERIVAVKKIHINADTIDDKLFRREVGSLMNINHRNIVQFLGFHSGRYQKQIKGDVSGEFIWASVLERLLCFEYISNGSLDNHITDELRGLDWEARYEIITGICKGLCYLHEEKNIIHMDLKPANILLHQDKKYMVPKITDFGLSRPNKNSHTVGQRYGTLEYMAPEYRDESKTAQSCDIYSLGLIIIELVTGSKDVPHKDNARVLRRWRHRWRESPTQLQYQQVTRCMDIAGHCRRKNPKDRPSISKIIKFLNESEYISCQISPCLDEDEMLQINPLELRLPYEQKDEMSHSVELTNDTRNCIIAFHIQLPSEVYKAQPHKGIVRPKSKYSVMITVQAGDVGQRYHANKFIVRSMQVEASEGVRDEDITEGMFENTEKFVDEVDLKLVYESTKPPENFKPDELKICESSSGSSGKAEAISMECTNFNPAERPNTQHIINRLEKTKIASNESENAAEAVTDRGSEILHGSDNVDNMAVTAPSDLRCIPNSPGETSSNLGLKDLVFTVKNEPGHELKQLRVLNNLHGSLEIVGLGTVTSSEEALEANLSAKEGLTGLTLRWSPSYTRCSPEVEVGILEFLCPPAGLKKLQVCDYNGSRYPDWMVGKQNGGPKDLQELRLQVYNSEAGAPQIVETFPHLRVLSLFGDMEALPSNLERLTSLKILWIGFNYKIRSLPTLPRSLEVFQLTGCNSNFMKSCQKARDPNYKKIEHIPKKQFDRI